MNLDGSAAWRGRSADELMDKFLQPFRAGSPRDTVHLLAVNDGRLLEWVEGFERRHGRTELTEQLGELLEMSSAGAAGEPPTDVTRRSHMRFIDLNRRSLVGGVAGDVLTGGRNLETGFLERLIDRLYGGEEAAEKWAPCRTCSAQERCEVFRAAALFGPDGLPSKAPASRRRRARQRLFEALQAVHLRGEAHITVRQLRAALVYVLFGVAYCSEYHAASGDADSASLSYADRTFSPESPSRQGEVLRELAHFDPALEAHPQVDRYLMYPPSDGSGEDAPPRYGSSTLASARRRAWFEWEEKHIEELTGQSDALALARGRHLAEFRDLALDDGAERRQALAERLCRGISRLQILPRQALEVTGVVALAVTPRTPTETAFWVEKSVGSFSLAAGSDGGREGLEQLHRQAFLTYRTRDGHAVRLRLGAELFHLLLELAEGYQLGDIATDDSFAHLSIFVERLLREDHRRLFAWNPLREDEVFEVAAQFENQGADRRQALVIAPVARRAGASDAG